MEVQILLSPQNNINIYGEMAKLEDATEYNEQIECVHIEDGKMPNKFYAGMTNG